MAGYHACGAFIRKNIIYELPSTDKKKSFSGEPNVESSQSFIQTERDAYPPPPSRVQLERTKGPADPEEDLGSSPLHRRSHSMPSERLEVSLFLGTECEFSRWQE